MKFVSPPSSLAVEGPLPAVVSRLVATVEAEARFAWEASERALLLTQDGRLEAGAEYEPSAFEADGFRSLVVRYNDSFPRAYTLLATLSAPTVAAIWREAYVPTDGRVQVVERHAKHDAPSAICGVYPPGYPVEYTVANVAVAVQQALGGAAYPTRLQYDAASSTLRMEVQLSDYNIVVVASDTYGEPAPSVEVVGKDGRNYGTPKVGPNRRRRPGTGGVSMSEGIVERIHAAPSVLR